MTSSRKLNTDNTALKIQHCLQKASLYKVNIVSRTLKIQVFLEKNLKLCAWSKHHCSSLNMAEKSKATLLFRLVVLTIYILLGSLLFSHIEIKQTSREELNDKFSRGISVLIKQTSCADNLSETQLKEFVSQVFEQVNVESNERWQFRDGLTFSFELLTTIGK